MFLKIQELYFIVYVQILVIILAFKIDKITPNTQGSATLGDTTKEWGDIYIADSKNVYGGGPLWCVALIASPLYRYAATNRG